MKIGKKKLFAEDVVYVFLFFNLIAIIHFISDIKKSIAFPIILLFWEGICAWFLIRKLKKRKFSKKEIKEILGIKKLEKKEVYYSILFIVLILVTLFIGIQDILSEFLPVITFNFPEPNTEMFWIPLLLILVIAAGVVEEITYRAFFMNTFKPRVMTMIGISTLLFMISHWYAGTVGIVTAGIIGIFLSLQYLLTKSSISTMITHILVDLALLTPFMISLAHGI